MTEKERVFIGGIELEAALTSGGLGTMCETYEGRVHRLDYKTLRYPGHFDQMHFLFDELNLRDQRELVGRILVDAKPPVNDDVVYLHAAVEGVKARPAVPRELRARLPAARHRRPHLARHLAGRPPPPRSRRRARRRRRAARRTGFIKQEDIALERPALDTGRPTTSTPRAGTKSLTHDRHRRRVRSDILERLGAGDPFAADGDLVCRSPIDGSELGRLQPHTAAEVADVVGRAQAAFEQWRTVPAPGARRSSCASWASCCASTRTTSAPSSRSRPARSSPRASARSRR